jgi:predicted RND superfamily exporter protein
MKFLKAFFKHPWIIITICVVLTAVLGFPIKDMHLDNSLRTFLPHKNDSYQRLIQTEKQYGSMVVIGASIESDSGDFITPENISIVKKVTDQVLEIPNVQAVDSLTHIDYVYGKDGGLSAGQLIDDSYTGTPQDIQQIKDRLSDWSDMYHRVIISDDGKSTQMQITVDPNTNEVQKQDIVDAVRKILTTETAGHKVSFRMYGDPILAESARSFMLSDLSRLIPLVIVVVLLTLFFSFKTLDGTLLPLLTVVMSTIWTCGIMAYCNVTFTIVTSVIPVALIAVGSAYGIHVLTHYYIALDAVEGELTQEKYRNAVFSGLKEVWMAVLLAGVTTIVGFVSLVTSPIQPLHSFAIFTAIGVAFALILAVIFIPALLLCKPLKNVGRKSKHMEELTDKVRQRMDRAQQKRGGKSIDEAEGNTLYNIYRFFCGTAPRLIVFSLVIVILSAVGLKHLVVDTALINYYPKDSEVREDINYIDKNFAGTNTIYFTVTGKEKGDMTKPEILKSVDDMQDYLEDKYEGVGKVVSFTTFIKRMNQVMHIPQTGASAGAVASSGEAASGGDVSSFADDSSAGSISSFADDASSDSVSSFSDDASTGSSSSAGDNFVDPNIEYSARLGQNMTTEQALGLLNSAYVKAGGKKAKLEDIVDVLESELNYNGRAYYEVPYDTAKYPVASRDQLSDLVSQYLLLFSGSLDRFTDDPLAPKAMRVTVQLRNHSTEETGNIIADAKAFAKEHFPEGYTIEATGAGEMEYVMTKMVVQSQLSSLIFSLLSVFIIVAIAYKSALAGLLCAVPLAFAILLNYMVMGFAHINLDLVTSIIASVAVGIGIDYTIHFLTTYREERAKSRDIEEVTRETFRKSGHGIITNALAVGLGFLVLYFSKFVVLRYIGILVAIVMFTSSALAMTIIPGILNIWDPKFIRPKEEPAVAIEDSNAEPNQ